MSKRLEEESLDFQERVRKNRESSLPSPNLTAEGIRDTTGRKVNEDFYEKPYGENYFPTKEDSKASVGYPLILLKGIGTQYLLNIVQEEFKARLHEYETCLKFTEKGKSIECVDMLLLVNNSKLMKLGRVPVIPKVLDFLDKLIIDYTYFKDKGVTDKINLAEHLDFHICNPIIAPPEEEYTIYGEEVEEKVGILDEVILERDNLTEFERNLILKKVDVVKEIQGETSKDAREEVEFTNMDKPPSTGDICVNQEENPSPEPIEEKDDSNESLEGATWE